MAVDNRAMVTENPAPAKRARKEEDVLEEAVNASASMDILFRAQVERLTERYEKLFEAEKRRLVEGLAEVEVSQCFQIQIISKKFQFD